MPNLYIDVHVLQTVPPSNLNRDDTGSPKQATYGGVRRARVSSQAWKRATRTMFASSHGTEPAATRTRLVNKMLTDPLIERGGLDADVADRLAQAVLRSQGLKVEVPKGADTDKSTTRGAETQYLLFLGVAQRNRIVDTLVAHIDELTPLGDEALDKHLNKEMKIGEELQRGHPIDVALFGRMVADQTSLNVDAAAQVAHAISTHPVETEFDYFTAVDDEKARDEEADDVGAGMIGTVEFNSATLYRYATLGVHQLVENLDNSVAHAADAVRTFVDCFTRAMPTGHQSSFAHRTLPHAVVVAVREDQPVNLVSAFETPVRYVRGGDGLAEQSLFALAREMTNVAEMWTNPPIHLFATYRAPGLGEDDAAKLDGAFGASQPLPALLDELHQSILAQNAASVGA